MTRFISVRQKDVGGPVIKATAFDCDLPSQYRPVTDALVAADVQGRSLVFAIHGFNVSRPNGVASLAALEKQLNLPPNYRFFGVLWPGDFWLPVVNYPGEGADAVAAGRNLASYVNTVCAGAASISLVSHSLGARVLLETARNLNRRAEQLCITAGAVDRDCLDKQYAAVRGKASRIAVLSSRQDRVLKLAYPAGDFIADLFLGDGDSPWAAALGLKGPKPPVAQPVIGEPIPAAQNYDHGDYFPPAVPPNPAPTNPKWGRSADYMSRALQGRPSYW